MSGKELLDEWSSSYELCSATNELNALTTTVFDFYKGKISTTEADKRVDDHSYRAMFFRDEYLKKSLQESTVRFQVHVDNFLSVRTGIV